MANKPMNRDRIIELFKKQTQEDKEYIITEIIKSLSVRNEEEKLKKEIDKLNDKLNLYMQYTSTIVKHEINEKLKNNNKTEPNQENIETQK
ncbi:MAG: hypothetical protein ACK5KT_15725 [Dysgonomonas sp.]